MTYLNIIEKLKVLFNMLLDYKLSFIFLIILLITTILFATKKIGSKKFIIITLTLFLILFGICIVSNYKVLTNTFDNFSTIFFSNIYFPSIYIYIFTLCFINISMVSSFLNKKASKIYRVVNSLTFIIMHILLVIILNIISETQIDIFSSSLYTNTNLVIILELSMNIFILWLLSLVVVYLSNVISERISTKKASVNVLNNITVDIEEDNNYEVSSLVDKPEIAVVSESISLSPIENNVSLVDVNNLQENVDINNNAVFENKFIINEQKIESNNEVAIVEHEEKQVTFSDLMVGNVPLVDSPTIGNREVTINEIINPEYEIEKVYNERKAKDINLQEVISEISLDSDLTLDIKDIFKEKKQRAMDNLKINTVSLNDLSKEVATNEEKVQEDIVQTENVQSMVLEDEKVDNEYTLDDYKKFLKMLKQLRIHNRNTYVKIDDAIAISLISNYSYEDCKMFKDILESCIVK